MRRVPIWLFPCCALALAPLPVLATQSRTPTNASVLPVVLTGQQMPALLGTSPMKLSAFSCQNGQAHPMLFQVDDVNPQGRVLGPGAQDSLAPDEEPGLIDANDELVVLLRDLGEPCPEGQLARVRGRLVPVRVSADYLIEPAYFYLLLGDRGYVPSHVPIHYDPATHTVRAEGYFWGYNPKRPFHYTRMGYTDLRGRSGEDILDRLKVRFHVRALGSLVTLNIDEDDFESTLEAMRVGPVRAVRELSIKIKTLPGFTIRALVTFYHYPRLWRAHIRFDLSKAVAAMTSSMDAAIIHDFTDLRGIRLSTSGLPQGALIDGQMIESERNIEFGPEPWYMINGLGLNQVTVIDLDPGLSLTASAIFFDSTTESDPPEERVGGLPSVGYQFLGWENLKPRWYSFAANIGVLPAFPEGGGTGFYRTLHSPLRAKALPPPPTTN